MFTNKEEFKQTFLKRLEMMYGNVLGIDCSRSVQYVRPYDSRVY